jgi:hypothetical protein
MIDTTSSPNFPRDEHEDLPFEVQDLRSLTRSSFAVSNQLFDRFGPELGVHGTTVYIALSRFADHDRTCSLPVVTISRLMGMRRQQVRRALAKLRRLKLIAGSWRRGQIAVRLLI